MIHDWLFSGRLLHPYAFAKLHYCEYPGFSIPYHPPVYPALLGAFFAVTGGISYVSARVFIAICLGAAGCIFAALLRRLSARPPVAFACALLFVTTPEIAKWSRDTMSEIPALMFALAGAYCFVWWLQTKRSLRCWAAFGFAELAFLSRVTTAGVIPGWFLFAFATRDSKAIRSKTPYVAAALYLCVNVVWVLFVAPFSKYETVANVSPTRVPHLSWANLAYYPIRLPAIAGWLTLTAAFVGLCCVAYRNPRLSRSGQAPFWIAWFASYYLFQLALAVNDQRYFTFAVPGIIGLVACLFEEGLPRPVRKWAAPLLLVSALVANVARDIRLSAGTVGYDAVAERIARSEKPGNILVASPEVSDLIFRYEAQHPRLRRRVLRGDRTLTLQLSDYAGVQPKMLINSADGVIKLVRDGRVRYLITYRQNDPTLRPMPETILAHETARSHPGEFKLAGTFPFVTDYDGPARVFLWEYQGFLPSGSADIATIVPTAGLELQCPSITGDK